MSAAVPHDAKRHLKGVVAVFGAGVVWSMGGVFFRLLDATNIWPVLFWRFLFAVIFFGSVLLYWRRGKFFSLLKAQGRKLPLAGFLIAGASIFFLFALKTTTVFNALMMLSLQPILAAALAWIFLKEPIRLVTWIAMLIAVGGVGIMVGGSLEGGGWLGNALALGSSFCFSAYSVMTRASEPEDSAAYTMMGGLIGALFALAMVFIGEISLLLSTNDFLLCLLMGCWQWGIGFLLFNWGSRQIPAAEGVLLAQAEVVLGPLWVWLVVGEVPAVSAMIGGGVLLVAVFLQASARRR